MHLHENSTLFDLWLWPWGQGQSKCCSVPTTSWGPFTCKVWGSYAQPLRRRCIYEKIHYSTFDLDLGVKVTQNVAQYPLHHVTYSPAKFEVATSNGLEGDPFTRNLKDVRMYILTHARTHGQTDRRTTDRLWFEINNTFFSKEKKAGITI